MRNSLLPVLIAVLILFGAGAFVTWIFLHPERNFKKIEIPESYLATSDTSRFSLQPVQLERENAGDSIMIFFPEGKSGSQVFLYDHKNYDRLLYGDHHGAPIPQPYAAGYAAQFGRPVLNLSGFAAGKYYIHVTSCNFGGFFEIQLMDDGLK
jgi:hypothetical protein